MYLIISAILGSTLISVNGCPEDCVVAASYASETIQIDGRLDEWVWQDAEIATNFTQYSPDEGRPATHQTEVRILYGENQVFISALLRDTEPEQIRRTLGRRDEFNPADWFIASIDSYLDRKTAYNFAVNAAGVQADGIYTGSRFGRGGGFDFDTSWNAVWQSAARKGPNGWVVEMRIPFTMLRFSDTSSQRWGINFRRIIPRLGEISDWVLIPRAERSSGTVAQYGTLEGIKGIRPRRNLQVTPYSVGNLTRDAEAVSTSFAGDIGVDVKVGLSPNMTLDATINPDFGQVESDPAELNLTAFETFFPEKRPFFTEGVDIFNYNLVRGGSLLYTRRIGSQAPVIGSAKLSGRTEKGLGLGFFGASTGENFRPENHYGVGRLEQQVGDLSRVGGMATFYRNIHGRKSYTAGTDWDIRLLDNRHRLSGQISGTHRTEDGDLDQGYAFTAGWDRQRSIWNYSFDLVVISDGYNPNDVGRLRQNNYVNFLGGVYHQINGGEPFGPFRRASALFFTGGGFSYDRQLHNGLGTFFRSDWILHGYNELEVNFQTDYLLAGYNTFETRGLDPRARPRELEFGVEYRTDSRRNWVLGPTVGGMMFSNGGRVWIPSLQFRWTVTPRLNLSGAARVNRELNTLEWAGNEAFSYQSGAWRIAEKSDADPSETEVWNSFPFNEGLEKVLAARKPWNEIGNHFIPVFGRRDSQSTDLSLRTGITLSPRLSIQFYGQLFAARGEYRSFEVLQNRDTMVPITAWPRRYDFAFSRFQSNTVVRWEYRPGSVLYVVWTQSRSTSEDTETSYLDSVLGHSTSRQLTDTFHLPPINVLLIKFSYKFLN